MPMTKPLAMKGKGIVKTLRKRNEPSQGENATNFRNEEYSAKFFNDFSHRMVVRSRNIDIDDLREFGMEELFGAQNGGIFLILAIRNTLSTYKCFFSNMSISNDN